MSCVLTKHMNAKFSYAFERSLEVIFSYSYVGHGYSNKTEESEQDRMNFNFVILLFLHVFIRSHSRPFYTGASALLLRRTRVVFDIALKVHRNIQHRDLEVGRNLGDCILRWLHKIKPSAQIRGPPPHQEPNHGTGKANMNMPKQVSNTSSPKTPRSNQSPRNHDAGRHLFSSLTRTWPKSFPTTIAMMMQPPTATGNMTRCRHLSINGPDASRLNYTRDQGVVRKDIMQWMVRK
ncbi:hypothetical protein Gogos_019766 [Gossypium gossypioides]|uniref:Uncharacterized protein n=1 Tax=Gossypium gossypioides TaxID=34282 RepID=A0A7J9BIE6_GOSGO|nr:hypothetical protein [Gossypium gossypioides]